ncbi:MAG: hypothetical protein FD137_229 [Spirochaetes bacterium]|nr:MAG: hypothetical protein FD137_229 [Spirochaetota bacterium]
MPDPQKRYENAAVELRSKGFIYEEGILGEMKEVLARSGYDPGLSETYFRGGSVSWMMLGDVSAEPYKTEKAQMVRKTLFAYAEKRLAELDYLRGFGSAGVHTPFHGARGVKFVIMGNDKERGTLDLVRGEGLNPERILFTGNELYHGGNDNMIRNIPGVTLLSVGEKTDPGEYVVSGGCGTEATRNWIEKICRCLDRGEDWEAILRDIRTGNAHSHRHSCG